MSWLTSLTIQEAISDLHSPISNVGSEAEASAVGGAAGASGIAIGSIFGSVGIAIGVYLGSRVKVEGFKATVKGVKGFLDGKR